MANDVETRTDDFLAFIEPVGKFLGNEVEKRSLEEAEIDRQRNVKDKTGLGLEK